jgi:DNA-binding transcriptional ArsR family regulator
LIKNNLEEYIEEIFGSKGRVRIMKVLTENGELNISEIGRRTGLNYSSVNRHLSKLEELGLVKEKRYGKVRIFETQFRELIIRFEKKRGLNISLV